MESDSSSDESDEIFDDAMFMSETSNASSEQNSSSFAEEVFLFIAKLYKFSVIPRTRTNDIIADVSALFKNHVEAIQEEMRIILEQFGRDSLNLVKNNSILEKISAPFRKLDTEFKRFARFKQRGTFVIPENYKLGDPKIIVEKEGEKRWKNKDLVAQFIPIRNVLKLYFELPGVLDKTIEYLHDVETSSVLVRNIVHGPLWKKKIEAYPNKIVIPSFVYSGDYENNNPLGSHKGVSKCGAVYYSVVLPPELQSKVENIFLFLLINSKHR